MLLRYNRRIQDVDHIEIIKRVNQDARAVWKKMAQQILSSAALRMPPTAESLAIDFAIDEEGYSVWAPVWVASMTAITDIAELVDDHEISAEELLHLADGLRRIAETTGVAEPPIDQKQYWITATRYLLKEACNEAMAKRIKQESEKMRAASFMSPVPSLGGSIGDKRLSRLSITDTETESSSVKK